MCRRDNLAERLSSVSKQKRFFMLLLSTANPAYVPSSCHPERSKGFAQGGEIFRFAQDDNPDRNCGSVH